MSFHFLLIYSYRNGFSNVRSPPPLLPFITSYANPNEPFDSDDSLRFPSNIEAAMTASTPSEKPPSIVDQAVSYHESIDPQAHSRRQITGTSTDSWVN